MFVRLRKSNALRRNLMHYAVEAHAMLEIYALFLPVNELCRIVVIGCTISEICADCLYFDAKIDSVMLFLENDIFKSSILHATVRTTCSLLSPASS